MGIRVGSVARTGEVGLEAGTKPFVISFVNMWEM